jgi:hypothetical protein
MSELERLRRHKLPATVSTTKPGTEVLPEGPRYGPRLSPNVTGVQVWTGHRHDLQRRLRKEMSAGRVAGAYLMSDRDDGVIRMEVQQLSGRPRNWMKIGILAAVGATALVSAVLLVRWVAQMMAAVALGASTGGGFVLLLILGLLLAAGGGTITVTTVTTIRRSWF